MNWFHNASSSALATPAVGLISAVSERDRARPRRSALSSPLATTLAGAAAALRLHPVAPGPEKPMVADAGARR